MSPGPQGRPEAAHNAPCSIVIHHDWPLMSHQPWTAPIVGTSQSVVAGWRQRPRVRRRHISRGSRDQTATHPRSGPALSSDVAHRTARVPERMATSRRHRAERTSSPRCAVGAGRNYSDLGPMFLVRPAIYSSIQQQSFVLRGQKTKRTTATTPGRAPSELDAPSRGGPGPQHDDASNSEGATLEVGADFSLKSG